MEVILREHVDNLGRRGDVVKVADGYARNYLLPRKLALAVTEENKRQIEREREGRRGARAGRERQAEALAQRLSAARDRDRPPRRRERDAVRLGDVGRHRARRCTAKGFDIDKRKIQLAEPLKALGETTVPVKIHRDVTAQVKVKVVPSSERNRSIDLRHERSKRRQSASLASWFLRADP